MLSRLPENVFFLYVNMTRKCHNHRLLTDPLQLKEGTWNTDIYNIIKVKQPALFLVKMIAELETKAQYKTPHPIGTTTKFPTSTHHFRNSYIFHHK